MIRKPGFSFRLLLLLASGAVVSCRAVETGSPADATLPGIMVWAWHGGHELEFLDPGEAGVAFLAGTVRVTGNSVALLPGADRVNVARGTLLLPVVRIEIDREPPAELGDRQLDDVVSAVHGFNDPLFVGLQLDFDATLSQRGFYRDLLAEVRRLLGRRFLSVTALPSWCLGDRWLPTDLVDELVPMLYRMGVDTEYVRGRLSAGDDFTSGCRDAVGVSDDEETLPFETERRLYLFGSQPWTASAYESLLARAEAHS